jgi:hypothetical protein
MRLSAKMGHLDLWLRNGSGDLRDERCDECGELRLDAKAGLHHLFVMNHLGFRLLSALRHARGHIGDE